MPQVGEKSAPMKERFSQSCPFRADAHCDMCRCASLMRLTFSAAGAHAASAHPITGRGTDNAME
jgi:hypothetical protein